jgi:ATP-dependent protease HslVU (ClpYQ) peptidase subunit
MTTIAGIQGDGFAVVCTDSRISSFDDSGMAYQVTTLGAGSSKIATNGKYVLGAAGDVRAINILHYAFTPPAPPANATGKKLDQFMTKSFIPSLRNCFEEQGYAMPERDSSSHMAEHSSTIFVVIHGVIYIVEGDYSWTSDVNGIYAIGTGAPYALGAIQALAGGKKLTPQQAKTILNKALSVAGRFDPYTGSPFQTFMQTAIDKKSSK